MPGEFARRSAPRTGMLSEFLREFTQVRALFHMRMGREDPTCKENEQVQQLLL